MDKIRELGASLLICQVLFGSFAYYFVALMTGGGEFSSSFTFALFTAGVVAATIVIFALVKNDTVVAAVGTSSGATIFAVISALFSLWAFVMIGGTLALLSAILAASVAKREGGAMSAMENFPRLFVSALPVVGAVLFFVQRRPHTKMG